MEYLTTKQVAKLQRCSDRYIRRMVANGCFSDVMESGAASQRVYLIPLESLAPVLQARYYRQSGLEIPEALRQAKRENPPAWEKPLEAYSAADREEIGLWTRILTDWQGFRSGTGPKEELDRLFLAECPERYGRDVSRHQLYRRWESYRAKDWDGLTDRRGRWRKGRSDAPKEIRDLFEYCYLDETALSVQKCMEAARLLLRRESPGLLDRFPARDTFYRWARELPAPVATLARKGDKAFNDQYGLFVDRLYDGMESNDFWIADGHRIDVITLSEDGKERKRRLTLSAFLDARSGIYVGWVVTDNPSSDATLLALRKAIQRYGIPRHIYVDNGRE